MVDIDELHANLDHSERARKGLENELNESAERINEFNLANANLAGQKRKVDCDLASLRSELDEANVELKNAEERIRKSDSDASRLASELSAEQVLIIYYNNLI